MESPANERAGLSAQGRPLQCEHPGKLLTSSGLCLLQDPDLEHLKDLNAGH